MQYQTAYMDLEQKVWNVKWKQKEKCRQWCTRTMLGQKVWNENKKRNPNKLTEIMTCYTQQCTWILEQKVWNAKWKEEEKSKQAHAGWSPPHTYQNKALNTEYFGCLLQFTLITDYFGCLLQCKVYPWTPTWKVSQPTLKLDNSEYSLFTPWTNRQLRRQER